MMNVVVLKLEFSDDKIKQKAMQKVSGLSGVESIAMNMKAKKLTVTGDIDPAKIAEKLSKLCKTYIEFVGPAEEREKKKADGEKVDGKKVVLKLEFSGDKIKQKAMQKVSGFSGVVSIATNMKAKKLTVTGDIDPAKIAGKLSKLCKTNIEFVGPAEEREKKADGEKADAKKVVLKLEFSDDNIKQKAMQKVSGLSGVESIAMNMKAKKLTVTGDIDPAKIAGKLSKLCKTYIEFVGLAEEREKKKADGEKADAKKVVLKLEFSDDKIKQKAMQKVSGLSGVESIAMNTKAKKLTVTGDIDPAKIAGKLSKLCKTNIEFVGPAEEREKKKVDGKKAEGGKADGKKADGKKANGEKADGKKADGEKANGKKADAKKGDNNKKDDKKKDSKKGDNKKKDAKDDAAQGFKAFILYLFK